ncbi:MAG: YdcF family protein [Acidobacteriota bacterium]
MLDSLAELTKSLFIPGTLTFLLFGLTVGVLLGWGPRRSRRVALPLLTALALGYWLASIPVVGAALATRFHARDAGQVTLADVAGAQAIVVLGAGIRNTYVAAGHVLTMPDPQTIANAVEAARIYGLFPGGLPVVASGGRQSGVVDQDSESTILREWLIHAGVPADRIVLESASRTTREQAQLVAPLLKAHHWSRFVLVVPAVQMPRAAAVFRAAGVDPVPAAAPFQLGGDRNATHGWLPNGGALRWSERATYDYLAWGYYWLRGWLK